MRHFRASVAVIAAAGALTLVGTAAAGSNNGPDPHDFTQNNMGYCAP